MTLPLNARLSKQLISREEMGQNAKLTLEVTSIEPYHDRQARGKLTARFIQWQRSDNVEVQAVVVGSGLEVGGCLQYV